MIEAEATLRLAVFFSVLAGFVVLERVVPARARTQNTVARSTANIVMFAIGAGLMRLIAPAGLAGVALAVDAAGYGLFNVIEAPGVVVWIVCLLALDLSLYAQHRAMHHWPLLWRFHAPHHADADLDASTGLRFHPGEYLISFAWKAAIVSALGAPAEAVIVFEIALNAFSIFTHANVRLPSWLERGLNPMIITPRLHRLHHDRDAGVHSGNYGFSIVLWDKLFGTFATREEPKALGLTSVAGDAGANATAMLTLPFRAEAL